MNNRVLVTGATGFIGNYVVRELLAHGASVIATSNLENAEQHDWCDKVEYHSFDLQQFDPAVDYFEKFGRPGRVIHLAWAGLPNYMSDFHLTENLPRQYALLENMVRHGLADLTVTGTCLEYGMVEGQLVETMTPQPGNPYAIAKDELRKKLESLSGTVPLSLKWLRLFYMYGKGQNPRSLFAQLDQAIETGKTTFDMSGGEQVRDFMPVEQVAEAIVKAAHQTKVQGIINCATNKPVTVRKFVEDYLKIRKATLVLNLGVYPYTSYEPMAFWGDNSKLMKIK